jgi:lipoate-protein ligase A
MGVGENSFAQGSGQAPDNIFRLHVEDLLAGGLGAGYASLMERVFPRLLLWNDTVAREGPEQMACDEALLGYAARPVLRVFNWSRPWVSAGYFVGWESAGTTRPDLPHCRRWTGGGVVVHDGDFTFAVAAPHGEAWARLRPAASYLVLHQALASALQASNPSPRLATEPALSGRECFASPVAHDVMVEGNKVAGGAQRRTRQGLLHQGSIQGARIPENFSRRLAEALGSAVEEWHPPASLAAEIALLAADKYRRPSFLQRSPL